MAKTELVEQLVIAESSRISEVLEVLNQTGHRTVLVVDHAGRLSGVITDGDLRRALLRGAGLSDPATVAANRNFVSLPSDSDPEIVQQHLSNRIMLVPLIDQEGRPVDFATQKAVGFVPAAEPVLGHNEINYVLDCVQSGWISSQGSYVSAFENGFAKYVDCPNALSVSNGTVALQLALAALGVGPGDEVIVPDLTFAASINAVIHTGATPVLVDVLQDEMTLDVAAAEEAITPATRAIMPVHLYGQMCEMGQVTELAAQHELYVIEDAAEALGSRWRGQHAGTIGDAGTFSFFGNKLITTGEGGMVVFKEPEVAARARMLRDHGMDPSQRYWHLDVGFNFRMTNLQAAIGVAQLERIDDLLSAKHQLAAKYSERLSDLSNQLILPEAAPDTDHSFWCYVVRLKVQDSEIALKLIEFMKARDIDVRPVFFPLHRMPPYSDVRRVGRLTGSSGSSDLGIVLPSSPKLTDPQIAHVCDTLRAGLDVIGVEQLLRQNAL
ncbi:aminotransferase class I/II-fold pyridoxal phosphate-dependent enzyme [Actibacterium pelagium]|nr:aminotransferase class I/II-fold pyridoxal phosphate-dependent enzyme [Actibacterium pelagium]